MGSKLRMARVALVHWNAAEAAACLDLLRHAGHAAELVSEPGKTTLRALRASLPSVILIDLSRLPSYGREVGVALRASPTTRRVPLVFVGGFAEKVERVRELLPDAVFATWDEIGGALRRALAYPPAQPVVPPHGIANPAKAVFEKLSIGPESRIALINPPEGIREALGSVPVEARFATRSSPKDTHRLCFIRALAEIDHQVARLVPLPPKTVLWLCGPKKAAGHNSDVTQRAVREAGFAAGLVDDKICSIDTTWSGLRFRTRKSPK